MYSLMTSNLQVGANQSSEVMVVPFSVELGHLEHVIVQISSFQNVDNKK